MQKYKHFLATIVFLIGISTSQYTPMNPSPTQDSMSNDLELLPIVQSLLSENAECILPCFWSFEPGQTTMEEVESFIRNALERDLTVGQTESSQGILHRSLILNFNNDTKLHGIALNFTFKNEILSLLHIDLSYPEEWLPENRFRISNLLSQENSFSEIYIGINTSTGTISLNLVDEANEVILRYSLLLKVQGNVLSPRVDRPLLLCPAPDLNSSISLWLQNQDTNEMFDVLASNPTLPNSSVMFYQTVTWMTDLNAEEFIQNIVDDPSKCIEMLSYPELLERGYGF